MVTLQCCHCHSSWCLHVMTIEDFGFMYDAQVVAKGHFSRWMNSCFSTLCLLNTRLQSLQPFACSTKNLFPRPLQTLSRPTVWKLYSIAQRLSNTPICTFWRHSTSAAGPSAMHLPHILSPTCVVFCISNFVLPTYVVFCVPTFVLL